MSIAKIVFLMVIFPVLAVIILDNVIEISELNQNVIEANAEYNKVVDRTVAHCTSGEYFPECPIVMPDWYFKCQKETMKNISACHDGRLNTYIQNLNTINSGKLPEL